MPGIYFYKKVWLIFLASGFLLQSGLSATSLNKSLVSFSFNTGDIDISIVGKDQEKLDNAKSLNNQANDLLLKANDLYMEASMYQQSGEFKKAEKAEDEALKTELEAAKLFEEANKAKKEVFKDAISKFWKEFDGSESELVNAKLIEETADEYFFRADELRKDAAKIKDKQEAYNKISEANETELLALEKLVSAYEIYDAWPASYSNEDLVTYPETYGNYESYSDNTNGSYSDSASYDSYNYSDYATTSTTNSYSQTDYSSYSTVDTDTSSYSNSSDINYSTNDSYSSYEPSTDYSSYTTPTETSPYSNVGDTSYSTSDSYSTYDTSTEYGSYSTTTPTDASTSDYSNYSTSDNANTSSYSDYNTSSTTDTYDYSSDNTEQPVNSSTSYSQEYATSIKQPENLGTDVKVDERLLQIFNAYQQKPEEVSEIDKVYMSQFIQDYNPETIRKLWDEYRENEFVEKYQEETPQQEAITETIVEESTESQYNDTEYLAEEPSTQYNYSTTEQEDATSSYNTTTETAAETQIVPDNYSTDTNEETTEEIGVVTESYHVPDTNAKIIYKVQIAANSAPLSQGLLRKLYSGNKNVSMINEGGWYKYSIGDFETFEEASEFKKNLNIKDAFIVAYRDAQKVSFTAVRMETSKPTTNTLGRTQIELVPDEASGNIVFEVQIAASKAALSKAQINNIYGGPEQVRSRQEEGWIKYQIGHTYSYDEARRLLATARIHGSFIVAYRNGKKLALWKAIMEYEQTGGIMFVVQVAASKKPLSEPQLKRIYTGNLEIREKQEEGWCKYQLVIGNSYAEARRARNNSGVNGAFVVAYKNNVKVNLREAIELSK